MKADPRQHLGTPTPTDAITGLPKKESETLLEFAERHGWEARSFHNGDDFIEDWRLVNGTKVADLKFWKSPRGSGHGQLTRASLHAVDIPMTDSVNLVRARIEAFLAGVDCICPWGKPQVACKIHGDLA